MAMPCRPFVRGIPRYLTTSSSSAFRPTTSTLAQAGVHRTFTTSATRSIRIKTQLFRPKFRKYSTVVVSSRERPYRRYFTNALLILVSFTTGSYLALSYAPPFLTSLIMGKVPTNEDTLRYEAPDEYSRQIDDHIKNCDLAKALRANPDFTESRPWEKLPEEIKQHNLTAGTLSGPDLVVVPPYVFTEKGGKSMVMILYVGANLSGHPGIVHGGFLATLMDEGLARCAFGAMPNKVGVTAQLVIDYRAPTMAGQFLVLRARTTKVEGRKAYSEGWIEALDDPFIEGLEGAEEEGHKVERSPEAWINHRRKLVRAEALFVEPKYARILASFYRSVT